MEYWKIPEIWPGGECWILGGGPSLPRQLGVPQSIIDAVFNDEAHPSEYSPYFEPIKDRHIIAINAAYLLGPFSDMVFIGDGNFYVRNRKELNEYPTVKVVANERAMKKFPNDNVKTVQRDHNHPFGITRRKHHVSWNGNSGMAAISMAYHLGARTIYLLGFDMMLDEGNNQHWHKHYKKGPKDPAATFRRHMRGCEMLQKDAKKLGINLLNVNPDSAIPHVPKMAFKDLKL